MQIKRPYLANYEYHKISVFQIQLVFKPQHALFLLTKIFAGKDQTNNINVCLRKKQSFNLKKRELGFQKQEKIEYLADQKFVKINVSNIWQL